MFDFFGDVISFLSSIVSLINWLFVSLFSFLSVFRSTSALSQVGAAVQRLPAEIGALAAFLLAAKVFSFIRGRKS